MRIILRSICFHSPSDQSQGQGQGRPERYRYPFGGEAIYFTRAAGVRDHAR